MKPTLLWQTKKQLGQGRYVYLYYRRSLLESSFCRCTTPKSTVSLKTAPERNGRVVQISDAFELREKPFSIFTSHPTLGFLADLAAPVHQHH